MKKPLIALFAGLLLCAAAQPIWAEDQPAKSDKAVSLFDGKTLNGWESPDKELWRVEDSCLTGGDGKKNIPYNDFLCTKASYGNFILRLKIKLTGDAKTGFINSGVQIRTHRNKEGHEVCGYQCDYGEPAWFAGIYDEGRRDRMLVSADMNKIHPAHHPNDWDDYVIKADGKNIKTWLNGVAGVDYTEADPDIAMEGIIGFQLHGGGNTIVQIKDVYLEELPPTPGAITWESLGGVDGQRAKLIPPAEAVRQPKFAPRKEPVDTTPKAMKEWNGDEKFWHAGDGALTAEVAQDQNLTQNQVIAWKGEAQDFNLTFEYRVTGSGLDPAVIVRGLVPNANSSVGYAAQLDDGQQSVGRFVEERGRGVLADRGARVSIAPDGRRWVDPIAAPDVYKSLIKPGDWNTARIEAFANHLELFINGQLYASFDDHQNHFGITSGAIAFQVHPAKGPAKFEVRKIQLADLGSTEQTSYDVVPHAPSGLDVPSIQAQGADGKPLNLGFETGTLKDWKAEGNAWEGQPIKGDTIAARNRGNSNHVGEYWIGGYEKFGDERTGTLTSASFEVTHPWGSFMVGGGGNKDLERVEIVDEATGKPFHIAGGTDDESMRRDLVDLRQHMGKKIFIRLVDLGNAGWGHINFDDFVFHDKAPAAVGATVAQGSASRQNQSPVLWHLQPNPAKPTAVANEAAQKVVAGMMLTHGFQAELIAADPDIKQPVAFAIDEKGRIWVAEAYSYPQKRPAADAKDRILIFEDVDGDGTFKKRTVFYEGLNLVSGMEVGMGGVFVGAAPELIFIPKDKDDKAGKPQILLDGWGYQDTHETLNSFCWGPDGWLYGNQGVFTHSRVGKPGTPDDKRIDFGPAIWRYQPQRHEFEIFCNGGSNQWGLDFNEAGDLFMTHCRSFWGGGGTSFVIRNGHLWNQANGGYARFISNSGADFAGDLQNYLPAAAKYDSGEGGAGKPGTTAVYGGHSHVGTMIYLGDNWPEIYRGHLFTNNLFGRQMGHQELVREGSAYQAYHAGYDLMFTPDETYMAIDLQTGPDGAVYMIDWVDMQHCHTPDVQRIDRTTGRMYRVSWAATYKPVKVDLTTKSDAELVALMTHRNDWYPRQARQLLQERAAAGKIDPQAIAALNQMATTSPDYAHVLRALWTLHVIGALDDQTLDAAMHNPDDRVRSWAIRLGTEDGKTLSPDKLLAFASNDPSAMVRLSVASALPVQPAETIWKLSEALSNHPEDATDRFLPKMIWYGLAGVIEKDWAKGLEIAAKTPLPALADSIRWYASRNEGGRDLLVSHIISDPESTANLEMRILGFGMRDEASARIPKDWPAARDRFAASLGGVTNQLSVLFGDQQTIEKMRQTLADDHAPAGDRRAAFELLKRINDAKSLPVFAKLLDAPGFRSEVITLLSASNDPSTAQALIDRFPSFNQKDRLAALTVLCSRPTLAKTLLVSVKDGKFQKKDLTSFQVRQLRNLNDADVNKMLDESWGKATESSGQMKATIARLEKAYGEAPLWAYDAGNGQKTFTAVCAACHTLHGQGGKLGPDLTGSGRNGVNYFLENIVDPNAVVGDQYQMTIIVKKDGTTLNGIAGDESDTAVTLRTATEVIIIPKADIQRRVKKPESMMPTGLLEAMPERNVIELLKFLTSSN